MKLVRNCVIIAILVSIAISASSQELTVRKVKVKKKREPWESFLHLKVGFYPNEEEWGCFPRGYVPPDNYDWNSGEDPVVGTYYPGQSIEIAFEISRPLWGLQLNFGIKRSKIKNNHADDPYSYCYKSNYLSYNLLFFPLRRDDFIQPFLISKFGLNYQGQNLEDNGRFLAVGIGSRLFFSEHFGVELLFEKQSLIYKRIPLGQGKPWHFKVSPFKISIGLAYKI